MPLCVLNFGQVHTKLLFRRAVTIILYNNLGLGSDKIKV